MGKLKQLTEEEAQDRVNWVMNHASREFWHAVDWPADSFPILDAKAIEKLHEISRVAREVANHYGGS